MSEPLNISVKILGKLALDNNCDRCFWLGLREGFTGIWGMPSPVYGLLDAFTKRHVDAIIAETGSGPAWLPHADKITESIKPVRMTFTVPGPNVVVRGEPDGVYKCSDGEYVLVDFKCSKWKDEGDMLAAMYLHQQNAYLTILEQQYGYKFKGAWLLYCSVLADEEAAADIDARRDDGFAVRLAARSKKLERNTKLLPDLACYASYLKGLEAPPASHPTCPHCKRLTKWNETLGIVPLVATAWKVRDDSVVDIVSGEDNREWTLSRPARKTSRP